jgi:saccharopine dehydrogenase-like NADP-dependent oxidoreductase
MKTILLFGAGKSATVLIHYLVENAARENWQLSVVDANVDLIHQKISGSPYATALSFDILKGDLRENVIAKADIVISLLPPSLHILVAKDCIRLKKNFLTASYVDEQMRELKNDIEQNDLLFLCEMGLDPGIDHMSAKRLIDDIISEGGEITSFQSHCGGLVAPESDNNPWHYKISWNPRNVVNAGKAGALFKKDGGLVELDYPAVFADKRYISIPGYEALSWYPNRDSLKYINTYGLSNAATFLRTTLRHPDFMYGWKNIIDLRLIDEQRIYDTDGKTLAGWFREHMDRNGFSEWLERKLHEQFDSTKALLSELVNLVKLEEEAAKKGVAPVEEFMVVDEKGDLQEIDIDYLKVSAAATLADKMHDAKLTLKQLFFLGMDDDTTLINKGICSAADVLQFALERKLILDPMDKDLVVMFHEVEFTREETNYKTTSTLLMKGENAELTAMAKTVGLPLGVSAKLILDGTLKIKGLHIPVIKEIYNPVLNELEKYGISFVENRNELK